MILCDKSIMARLELDTYDPLHLCIDPFYSYSDIKCGISRGLTSGGYDMTLGHCFKLFTNVNSSHIDPKRVDPGAFISITSTDPVLIPPNSFALGVSVERFRIPRDVIATCLGKSTYARCGIMVCVTPLEPEWEGVVTIEISNTTPSPAVVYPGEGIMQVLFHMLDNPCMRSYADKGGKYQGQVGVTLPKADR